MTSLHSSSFIRMARLSRVTPALLTRMSSLPPSASTACGTSASTAAPSERLHGKRDMIAAEARAKGLELVDVGPGNRQPRALPRQRLGDRRADARRRRRSRGRSFLKDRTCSSSVIWFAQRRRDAERPCRRRSRTHLKTPNERHGIAHLGSLSASLRLCAHKSFLFGSFDRDDRRSWSAHIVVTSLRKPSFKVAPPKLMSSPTGCLVRRR